MDMNSVAILVAVAISIGAVSGAVALLTNRDEAGVAAGLVCMAALCLAGSYGPYENPDRLAERAACAQIAGLYYQAERQTLTCQERPLPYACMAHKTGMEEGEASERADEWLNASHEVDIYSR